MTPASEWDEDGLVKIGTFARMTGFSPGYVTGLFDANLLPGMKAGSGKRTERRIFRPFVAALFASIGSGGEVVTLEDFAAQWKAAQAEGRAA